MISSTLPNPTGSGKRPRSRDRSSTPPFDKRGKRRRADRQQQQEGPTRSLPATGLFDMPVELLYSIHLYAKNPAFVLINKHIHSIFRSCPTSIKARYLLARWHEAYCYGNHVKARGVSSTSSATQRRPNPASVPNRPPIPATASSDLLENGALPELSWSSRFLPVLPSSELPYPLSQSFQRSADHFVLDYCLRYGLTDLSVLNATEELIFRSPEFGNIIQATGLWRDADGVLQPYVPRTTLGCSTPDDDNDPPPQPVHLRVTELPKRLFQSLKARRAAVNGDTPASTAPQSMESYGASLPTSLVRCLTSFGNGVGPFPTHSSLLLLLSIAAQHVITNSAMPAASEPFNSFDGLPLAKATFARSAFMVQLLLALDAQPQRKGSLSIYIAIRSGWLDGLQQLVERDESKMMEWESALDGIRTWFVQQEGARAREVGGGSVAMSEGDVEGKMRRASDALAKQQGAATRRAISSSMIRSPHKLPAPVPMRPPQDSTSDHLAAAADEATVVPSSASPGGRAGGNAAKRRRLLDRASLDSKMLKEAVKHNAWPVANWLRSKGLVPDLRTIKLIELKQAQSGGSGGRVNDTLPLT